MFILPLCPRFIDPTNVFNSAFIVQLVGGVMGQNGDASMVTLGLNIYSGGVALQQVFILSFITLIIIFHRKALRGEIVQGRYGWKRLLYPLYATLLLITVNTRGAHNC